MEKKYYVYLHRNKINNKVYIGITCQIPHYRWGGQGQNYKSNPHFSKAIEEYGWDNFEHEILYQNLTLEEACEKEIVLIKKYNSTNPNFGYNLDSGGRVKSPSDATRERQRVSASKRPPVSDETKKRLSEIGKK